ncbi:MAG: ribosome-associated translation inhibitor RaiA [Clostridiales bacterium]|nr:ribosome-associated translation inhibitor RaiA [Clostridiales bacterium]
MINITARGFDLKQGPKDGVEKELKRVENMLPSTADFDVTLSKKTDSYQCDITVKNAGSFIRGEARADRIEPSIDYAVDDLKRKLRKLKTSLVDKKRKSGIDILAEAMTGLGETEEAEEANPSTEIRRRKHVLLNMMTDDEAIVQMEMLGHSFFVYLGEDGMTHVVYRRKNGYGVLDCEM